MCLLRLIFFVALGMDSGSALNKTYMEVNAIEQLSRFHCIMNYGTQILSLKKSQSAANIWNFP